MRAFLSQPRRDVQICGCGRLDEDGRGCKTPVCVEPSVIPPLSFLGIEHIDDHVPVEGFHPIVMFITEHADHDLGAVGLLDFIRHRRRSIGCKTAPKGQQQEDEPPVTLVHDASSILHEWSVNPDWTELVLPDNGL